MMGESWSAPNGADTRSTTRKDPALYRAGWRATTEGRNGRSPFGWQLGVASPANDRTKRYSEGVRTWPRTSVP